MEEGVEGGVSASDDSAGDSLGESAGIGSSMAEMSPKVVNQYFIWFAHLLKYVPIFFFSMFHTLRMIRVGHNDRMKLLNSVFQVTEDVRIQFKRSNKITVKNNEQ